MEKKTKVISSSIAKRDWPKPMLIAVGVELEAQQ
jgi:hypothetical protein